MLQGGHHSLVGWLLLSAPPFYTRLEEATALQSVSCILNICSVEVNDGHAVIVGVPGDLFGAIYNKLWTQVCRIT